MEPLDSSPEESALPEGEFHHFQLVNAEGEIPMSVSVLIHLNPKAMQGQMKEQTPISTNEVIAFHEALQSFNGDFISAFRSK